MSTGTEPLGALAIKYLVGAGAIAGALVAIGKVIKWFQGPAAANSEKLVHLHDTVSDISTRVTVIETRFSGLGESLEVARNERHETRDEIKGIRQEMSDIRDAILKIGRG